MITCTNKANPARCLDYCSVPESSFPCFHITEMVVAVAVVGVMITLFIST